MCHTSKLVTKLNETDECGDKSLVNKKKEHRRPLALKTMVITGPICRFTSNLEEQHFFTLQAVVDFVLRQNTFQLSKSYQVHTYRTVSAADDRLTDAN